MKTLLKICLFAVVAAGIYWFIFYQTPQQKEFKKTLTAAQQGQPEAMMRAGDFYIQGYGIEPNKEQAVMWYRQAFQKEAPQAAWKLAQFYLQEKNTEEAAAYLQLSAQENNILAQAELARFYEQGLGGLPRHQGQAFYWYKIAAQNGSKPAEQWLTKLQTQEPDFFEQEENFFTHLQAAKAGEVSSMVPVARAYETGLEILPDMQQAEHWFSKAWQEDKNPQTGYELAQFYLKKDNPLASEEKAIALLAQLAALAYAPAQYDLGERSYQENPPNYQDAFAWFSNAATNGDARGQYMTGFMLMQGQGMTRSVPLAIQFFKESAMQNYPAAQYVLGQIYYKGLGVAPNKKQGKEFLKRAAQNGSVPAQVFLENISQ